MLRKLKLFVVIYIYIYIYIYQLTTVHLIPSRTLKTLMKATIWTAHRPLWIAPVIIQNSTSRHVIHEQFQHLAATSGQKIKHYS